MKALLSLLLLAGASAASGQAYHQTAMTAPELAQARGGFDLPGGVTVTIGATTDTRIDGQEVLRTVLSVADGPAKLAVLATPVGQTAANSVALDPNGAATAVRDGSVRLLTGAGGTRVELAGDAVRIDHLVGNALGSVVANTGSGRTIEVTTTVDIGLAGVRPDQIGGALARVDTLALDATRQLAR